MPARPTRRSTRNRAVVFVVVASLALPTAGTVGTPTASAAGGDSFVTRNGTMLTLDGLPFRFGGVNIYNANSDEWCAFQYTDAELAAALDEVGPGQVVRAWFFQPLAASKTAGSPKRFSGTRDWTRFDRTVDTAAAKGIRLIATLTDQWGECGASGVSGYKTDAWYRTGYLVPDPGQVAEYDNWVSYRDWVAEVVARYADRPEILAWQLINEGEARTAHPDDPGVCPSDASSIMSAWASDISTLVRSLDTNHLISLGTIGSGQCGAGSIAEYRTLHDLPNIDLCEFHDYDNPAAMPGDQYNGLQTRIDICNGLDKPLFVGEVGLRIANVGSAEARADIVEQKILAQTRAGVVGHLGWIYNPRHPAVTLDPYDIASGDPELAVLASARLDVPIRLTTSPAEDQLPAFSPDGARIAFVSQGRDSAGQDLFVMNADGSAETNISCDPSFPGDPRPCRTKYGLSSSGPPYLGWSPDGAAIAYTVDTQDSYFAADIWLAAADGSGKQNITAAATGTIDRTPVFSPDGRLIHFDRSNNPSSPAGDSSFYSVMNADGSYRRDVRGIGNGGIPHWRLSADGFKRVYGCIGACAGGVQLMNADGTNHGQVTSDPSDNDPILSPDGTRIVFARGGSETDLFVVSADGSGLRQVTTTPGVYETPTAWSIDGRHIAIEATDTSTGLVDVVVLDVDIGDARVIGTPDGSEGTPSFSPDGRLVVYSGDTFASGNFDIYLVELYAAPVDSDATPPTIAIGSPAQNATFEQGASVTVDYSCADGTGGSGIAFCSGSTPDGGALDTSTLGSHEFQVVASDLAGHRVVETRRYTVVEPLGPGDLDPSFSANGFTLTPFEQTSDPSIDVIEGFAMLPDGRMVASGSSRDSSGQSNVVVAVYDQDGDLDPSFSGDGKVYLDLGADDEGDGVAYQPGRGIVVGGYSSGELIALRFELDGGLDPTFGGGDGIVKFSPLGEFGYAWKTAIDPAGRIVMAGQIGVNGDALVARLEDDGALDPTFGGGDGIARVDTGTAEYASSLTFDSLGRIIVTSTGGVFNVLRFTEAGELDLTFAADGVATANVSAPANAFDAAVDAAGRIVAVGTSYSGQGIVVARLEDDGDHDPTFDGDGIVSLHPTGGSDQGNEVAIQADGRIVIAGVADATDGGDLAVMRLLGDGSLDASFSDDGFSISDLGGQDWANEMALDSAGRIVVAGFGGPDRDFAVARYLAAAPPDTQTGEADPTTGGTASTGGAPTPDDPVETTVIVPGGTAGGSISISESDVSTVPAPTGYDLLGQEIQITAPSGTAANPLRLVFLFDGALAASAGVDQNTIQILRNGAPVAGCVATGPISPDPCVSVREPTADLDIRLEVLTSQASTWSGARREPFAFTGFLQPVDDEPTLNRTKAGTAVPVKFSLGGNQGLNVFAATYPRSVTVPCVAGAVVDAVEQTSSAGSSSLSYDAATGVYTYTWKTEKKWANTCRQLVLQFADGSFRRATFDFRR